ncbi:MAG: hypothetical protein IJJ33_01155 [Victivallales bacterium]|nr:hypothetical protein [Victivallales bacterium]
MENVEATMFYGCSQCTLDAQFHLKLPEWAVSVMKQQRRNDVVFFGMPEGCLAIFPIARWRSFRNAMRKNDEAILNDSASRMQPRLLGSMSRVGEFSSQGKVHLPAALCQALGLGGQVMVVGAEWWLELWSPAAWERQLVAIQRQFTQASQPCFPCDAPRL